MEHKIENEEIQKIIHNIAEDFRYSGEYEKYAQLFYAVDATKTINDKAYGDMMEYLRTSLKELQKDLKWRQDFLSENPQIEEQRLTETMQTIEKEYLALLDYLKGIG
jgi:Arc/MetJ-type ribon-helix-helix transcriptional regulator